jgi:hypothetical protein
MLAEIKRPKESVIGILDSKRQCETEAAELADRHVTIEKRKVF